MFFSCATVALKLFEIPEKHSKRYLSSVLVLPNKPNARLKRKRYLRTKSGPDPFEIFFYMKLLNAQCVFGSTFAKLILDDFYLV